MNAAQTLMSLPVDQWKVGQVYSYHWHDGPCEGVCALIQPGGEYYFELLDERYNPDGLDDRVFKLSELPAGSLDKVLAAAGDLAGPNRTHWQRGRERLDEVKAQKQPTPFVIWSRDMEAILGCWQVESPETKVKDWFSFLGIPVPEETPEEP